MAGVYLHVLADALTSVLALVALGLGAAFGWNWLDPIMGLVGAALILQWSRGLVGATARQLLDVVPSAALESEIRKELESIDDVRVADLHLWDIGPGRRACIVALVTHTPRAPAYYRARIVPVGHLESAHVTI